MKNPKGNPAGTPAASDQWVKGLLILQRASLKFDLSVQVAAIVRQQFSGAKGARIDEMAKRVDSRSP